MNAPLDPNALAHELSERGLAWADADAAACALEETKSTVLSQLAADHLGRGESAAKAELLAKASPEYRDHLESMVNARKTANRARVRWDTYKAYVELIRSAESSRRAEMGMR